MDYEKKYKEALERAEELVKQPTVWSSDDICQKIFPELTESEGERIRGAIIDHLKDNNLTEWVAWLEKQCGQDNSEDVDILHRFSFYSYKDEPNILYLSGLYVKEEYRNKGIGTKILEVADEVAKSLNCHSIRLKTKKDSNAERLYRTHGYNSLATEERDEIWLEKQGEQRPAYFSDLRTWKYIVDAVRSEIEGIGQYLDSPFTEKVAKKLQKRFGHIEQSKQEWSEEDEQYLLVCKNALAKYQVSDKWDAGIISRWLENRLKTICPQKQWKPTEEQMRVLECAYGGGYLSETDREILGNLYDQLKEL